jgi:hypothetical protein
VDTGLPSALDSKHDPHQQQQQQSKASDPDAPEVAPSHVYTRDPITGKPSTTVAYTVLVLIVVCVRVGALGQKVRLLPIRKRGGDVLPIFKAATAAKAPKVVDVVRVLHVCPPCPATPLTRPVRLRRP